MTDALTRIVPSDCQLRWQALEFYAFLHFGMNTVTDREWGTGRERARDFSLTGFDPDQWMRAIAAAGLRGVILTAKHHDGFCLWPTATTDHSLRFSGWQDGTADIVRAVADAARRHDLAFGVYLSPWDRHDERWGSGSPYDDLFVAQLTELLTDYGDVFCVWFDGAMGDDPARRQPYDWDRYFSTVRRLQPDAVISVCGPDVRWCGNEAGQTRPEEWSVVPGILRDAERTSENSQKVDDGTFRTRRQSRDQDLGSRAALEGVEDDLVWYPAEVNTSIRPGWFHHSAEDAEVRDADELFEIYLASVGGNASFLLGLAPSRAGILPEPDVRTLAALGERVAALRTDASAQGLRFSSGLIRDAGDDGIGRWPQAAADGSGLDLGNGGGWWSPDPADPEPAITFAVPAGHEVYGVILKEEITASQRIEEFRIDVDGREIEIDGGRSVGYQRIVRFPARTGGEVTIRLTRSRGLPVIAAAALLSRHRSRPRDH